MQDDLVLQAFYLLLSNQCSNIITVNTQEHLYAFPTCCAGDAHIYAKPTSVVRDDDGNYLYSRFEITRPIEFVQSEGESE